MKTSNKILLATISVLGLSLLSILIFAKSSLIKFDQDQIKGNGKIVKMDYPIEDISIIDVEEFFEVYVTIGETKLQIETDENIQALLYANTDNYQRNNDKESYRRVLKVQKLNNAKINPTSAIKLFLAVPTLEGIQLDNHASVIFEEVMTSEKFEIKAGEFSKAKLKLNTSDLEIDADNHSTINIEGKVGETKVQTNEFVTLDIQNIDAENVRVQMGNHSQANLSGNTESLVVDTYEFCEVNAGDIIAKRANINVTNHSNITLNVTESLEVRAKEHSTIRYRGNPTISKFLNKRATLQAIE